MIFNKKMLKRTTLTLIAAVLTAMTVITMPAPIFAASETAPYNWYAKRNSDHTLPRLEPQFEFINAHRVFYGDKKAAESEDKVIYLTFDAGYENGNIARVLDALKKNDVKGAFFVLENLAIRNPELIKRMADEGHLICNHTRSHPDMTKLTDKSRFALQLSSLEDTLREKCGVECKKFYRPPEGRFSEQSLKYADELGYTTVFWSFAYADWDNNAQPLEKDAIKKILDNAHPGEIMLLHPTSRTNAEILDSVIKTLKADGYRFATLDELTK